MFGKQSGDAMAPLIFAIIKALTPEDVSIAFYDENVEKIPDGLDAEVVAMTVDTFSARRAYQLSAAIRAQGPAWPPNCRQGICCDTDHVRRAVPLQAKGYCPGYGVCRFCSFN